MTSLDLVFFLVAGIAGTVSFPQAPWTPRVAWFIVGLWAFLKLVHAI